jgi:hypothetical protein
MFSKWKDWFCIWSSRTTVTITVRHLETAITNENPMTVGMTLQWNTVDIERSWFTYDNVGTAKYLWKRKVSNLHFVGIMNKKLEASARVALSSSKKRMEREKKDGSNDLTCCSFAFEETKMLRRPSCLPRSHEWLNYAFFSLAWWSSKLGISIVTVVAWRP